MRIRVKTMEPHKALSKITTILYGRSVVLLIVEKPYVYFKVTDKGDVSDDLCKEIEKELGIGNVVFL